MATDVTFPRPQSPISVNPVASPAIFSAATLRATIGAISSHHLVTIRHYAESTHDCASTIRRRRRRMGDVPQSCLPALDAHELQGHRPCARNALSKHRKGETLRLRRLRLKAH